MQQKTFQQKWKNRSTKNILVYQGMAIFYWTRVCDGWWREDWINWTSQCQRKKLQQMVVVCSSVPCYFGSNSVQSFAPELWWESLWAPLEDSPISTNGIYMILKCIHDSKHINLVFDFFPINMWSIFRSHLFHI